MPNLQLLGQVNNLVGNLSKVVARHTVYMNIVIERLSITEEEYQATKEKLYAAAAKPEPVAEPASDEQPDSGFTVRKL